MKTHSKCLRFLINQTFAHHLTWAGGRWKGEDWRVECRFLAWAPSSGAIYPDAKDSEPRSRRQTWRELWDTGAFWEPYGTSRWSRGQGLVPRQDKTYKNLVSDTLVLVLKKKKKIFPRCLCSVDSMTRNNGTACGVAHVTWNMAGQGGCGSKEEPFHFRRVRETKGLG